MATHRADWEKSVEDQLKKGSEQFSSISRKLQENTDVTKKVEAQLGENTAATLLISNKLDAHIESYETFTKSTQPAIDAILTMQAGVRVIGKIGNAIGWLANHIRKGIIWIAPLVAFAITMWSFFHDKPAEVWRTIVDWWAK